MSKPIRPAPTEYSVKLRAWKRSVIEWVGLDPADVLDVDVREDVYGFGRVEWESISDARPTRGKFERFDMRSDDAAPKGCIFTGFVHLDFEDAQAIRNEVGPKPRIMSSADEARLRAAFGLTADA